jgi:hypothetical protein
VAARGRARVRGMPGGGPEPKQAVASQEGAPSPVRPAWGPPGPRAGQKPPTSLPRVFYKPWCLVLIGIPDNDLSQLKLARPRGRRNCNYPGCIVPSSPISRRPLIYC